MAKKHSEWSASQSARNMACPGSLTLAASAVSPPSIYAAWGTSMHTIVEQSIREKVEPFTFLDSVGVVDGFEILVNEEMVEAATVCADYVKARADQPGATLWIEETFDLAPLGFPLQAGGTSDAVLWLPEEATIEVVDYKGGRGKIVEVLDNTQLGHYGLGALVKHPELPADRVRMTIIQPRAPHEDGIIRSVDVHVSDLVDFANDIDRAMRKSVAATAAYHMPARYAGEVEAWSQSWLRPGDHCQFCPAAGSCPALRAKSQEMVGMFWTDAGAQQVEVAITDSSPEAVERDLEGIELIEQWIAARRAYAHLLAEGGYQFDNWTLVERNGHRRWNDAAENEAAEKIHAATGLAMVELFTKKLKSPNGIEKMLGSAKGKIADLFYTPVTGKDLVRRSKAGSRRPAKSLVDVFFNSGNEELLK